jgi:hypothetical protein
VNLKLWLQDLDTEAPGCHPMDYMKLIGVGWETAISVPLADAWWFCECRNIPDPLPHCLEVSDCPTETIITFGDDYAYHRKEAS